MNRHNAKPNGIGLNQATLEYLDELANEQDPDWIGSTRFDPELGMNVIEIRPKPEKPE